MYALSNHTIPVGHRPSVQEQQTACKPPCTNPVDSSRANAKLTMCYAFPCHGARCAAGPQPPFVTATVLALLPWSQWGCLKYWIKEERGCPNRRALRYSSIQHATRSLHLPCLLASEVRAPSTGEVISKVGPLAAAVPQFRRPLRRWI